MCYIGCGCALLTSFISSVVMDLLFWSIAPSATMMILSRFLSARFYKGKKACTHTHSYTHTYWWEQGEDTHVLHCIRADGVSMSVCGSLGHYDYIKTRTSQTALRDKHWRTETSCACVFACMHECVTWLCSYVRAWQLGETDASQATIVVLFK